MSVKDRLVFHRKIRNLHSRVIRAREQGVPPEIKIEITSSCNMGCPFCYNKNTFAKEKRGTNGLSLEKLYRVIDKIADESIPIVRFTGGEPSIHKDFLEVVRYAKEKKLYVKLNTNATLMTKENIDAVKNHVDEVLVSFHDYYKSEPKEIIKKKVEGIKALRSAGVLVFLNTVLTKNNISRMQWFLDKAEEFDCKHFFAFPVPTDKMPEPVSHDDIKKVIEWMLEAKKKGIDVHLAQAIAFCSYEPDKIAMLNEGVHCGMHDNLVVDPSGKIKMCYSLPEPIGDVETMSFLDAWNSETVKGVRELRLLPKPCRECKYMRECLGGCRFAAYLATGNLCDMDPLAQPEKYKKYLFK
jgi:radical SAM protein with 4Fe4S-binding SPASM domain